MSNGLTAKQALVLDPGTSVEVCINGVWQAARVLKKELEFERVEEDGKPAPADARGGVPMNVSATFTVRLKSGQTVSITAESIRLRDE